MTCVYQTTQNAAALLLATSNRSEVALGYATMDGDTSGGLSPLAGIDKDFLRHWLRWLEKSIPALKLVNQQSPTAELRPAAMTQTDEADLMPYSVLNRIEQAAIRDRQTPSEIFYLLKQEYEEQQLITWIERFFTLWSRNQWKRERFAPCFHLDEQNIDPKTWCRFPILSGGYKKELEDMKERFIVSFVGWVSFFYVVKKRNPTRMCHKTLVIQSTLLSDSFRTLKSNS